jgi:hypothetical protein
MLYSSYSSANNLSLSFLRIYKHPETGIDCQEVVKVCLWDIERFLHDSHTPVTLSNMDMGIYPNLRELSQRFHFLGLNIDQKHEVMRKLEEEKEEIQRRDGVLKVGRVV